MNPCVECEKVATVKCCHNCKKDANKCQVFHACGEDCNEWEKATNADRVRALSDEELAMIIALGIGCVLHAPHCMDTDCTPCMLKWLKQPAEDER